MPWYLMFAALPMLHFDAFDGNLAEVPLPEYAISEIRTGQYVRVDGSYNHLCEGVIGLNE